MIEKSEIKEPLPLETTGRETTARLLSTVGSRGLAHLIDPDTAPSGPNEAKLTGKSIEALRVSKRLKYLERINGLKQTLKTGVASWRNLLSGEVSEVSGGGVHPNDKQCLKQAGGEIDKSLVSIHTVVKTGVDYPALQRDHPTERYKFYHSFGNQQAAEAYLTDVMREAIDRSISMTAKTFDHAYDGVNIYTHHFPQMQAIIQDAYARHPDAWGETEHFLQGAVPNIEASHIGWVQEPIAGLGHLSHSGRMGVVGETLDSQGLDEAAYRQGCQEAGVRPDMPWLLAPAYEQQLMDVAQSRTT